MKTDFVQLTIVLCICSSILPNAVAQDEISANDRLYKRLFSSNYEINSRPAELPLHSVTVNLSIDPFFIESLDEESALFSIHGSLSLAWEDYRLRWNPSEFSNIAKIRIPSTKLWLPDIRIYNSPARALDPKASCNAVVSSSGKVLWVSPTKFEFFCPDPTFSNSPTVSGADRVCVATIGSWTYDGWLLNIYPDEKKMKFETFVNGHPKWKLLTSLTALERSEKYYTCCEEPYVTIMATFPLKKLVSRDQSWQSVIALPCAITACLALWSSFSRNTLSSNIRTTGMLLLFLSVVLIYVCTETNLAPGSTDAGLLVIWTTVLVFSNILVSNLISNLVLRPAIIQSNMVTKLLSTPVKNVLMMTSRQSCDVHKESSMEEDEEYYALKNGITGIVAILHAIAFITVIVVYT